MESEGETMAEINNLRQIREIYGATQEQVAKAIAVNRVTVANWEAGNSIASSANREKLSLYYGIGPEYFMINLSMRMRRRSSKNLQMPLNREMQRESTFLRRKLSANCLSR